MLAKDIFHVDIQHLYHGKFVLTTLKSYSQLTKIVFDKLNILLQASVKE